jgi:hypothetical protein
MKGILTITVLSAGLVVGCATRGYDASSQTAPPPAGPVQTSSAEPGVIPAGTTFSIRTNEEIKSAQPGQTFMTQVEQDIMNQAGALLVPKGSSAELVVVESQEAGTTGTAVVELALRSVTVRGREYPITTGAVERRGEEGLGANRRTAETVGGGAVLGTIIGAIAGGARGAAVGAAVGAAGGAAAQVLTRGPEVRVPAETILTFTLDQPWRLQGFQS